MLSDDLLKILCCPKCKGDLEYKPEESLLRCTVCGTEYEVKDDIPIMLTKDDEQ